LKETGKISSIGVSNFTVSKLKQLIDATGIVPEVNQVELHPFLPQQELIQFCKEQGIVVEAYSPLGSGRKPYLLHDETVNHAHHKII
jgi:diketogulonate reductase-like aldo/keto reductase